MPGGEFAKVGIVGGQCLLRIPDFEDGPGADKQCEPLDARAATRERWQGEVPVFLHFHLFGEAESATCATVVEVRRHSLCREPAAFEISVDQRRH